jgi:hypothetical protein
MKTRLLAHACLLGESDAECIDMVFWHTYVFGYGIQEQLNVAGRMPAAERCCLCEMGALSVYWNLRL